MGCVAEKVSGTTILLRAQRASAEPRTTRELSSEVACMHLVQCIPKGKKLDLIIRQSVELGVSRISLIQSRNSIPDLSERWDRKREHLEGIVREAYQQSGGNTLTVLEEPRSFETFFKHDPLEPRDLGLFFHEQELEKTSLHEYLGVIPREIRIVIGPEGGLAPEELQLLQAASYRPVYLGKQVLRCETAAVAGLGALRLIMREHPFWSTTDRKSHE